MGYPNQKYVKWDHLYENWRDSLIILVKYNTPQKPYTISEVYDTLPQGYSYNVAEYIYYENTKPVDRCATPIDDVIEIN